jgi:hypothetical protein
VCAHACERGARVTRLAQAGVSRRNLFEEVPIVIRNSALVSAFLAEWAETQTTASFEQLEVRDTHTHIERECVCVCACVCMWEVLMWVRGWTVRASMMGRCACKGPSSPHCGVLSLAMCLCKNASLSTCGFAPLSDCPRRLAHSCPTIPFLKRISSLCSSAPMNTRTSSIHTNRTSACICGSNSSSRRTSPSGYVAHLDTCRMRQRERR